jgi:uncharacterized surface protein with fasciclin (FAS1) repeats
MAMKRLSTLFGIASLAASVTACSSSSPTSPSSAAPSPAGEGAAAAVQSAAVATPARAGAAKPGPLTIVGVLQDDDEFDVLQAAVVSAGLVAALNGTTQYTVFAPTDQAFANALGGGSEAAALDAIANIDLDVLKDILLFHVAHGRRISASVLAAPRYQMLNGKTLTRTQLSAAGIARPDVPASNGIVHVINGVLIPAS